MLKPACLRTETCLKLEIMCVASLANVTFLGVNNKGAAPLLFAFHKVRFSHDEAHTII